MYLEPGWFSESYNPNCAEGFLHVLTVGPLVLYNISCSTNMNAFSNGSLSLWSFSPQRMCFTRLDKNLVYGWIMYETLEGFMFETVDAGSSDTTAQQWTYSTLRIHFTTWHTWHVQLIRFRLEGWDGWVYGKNICRDVLCCEVGVTSKSARLKLDSSPTAGWDEWWRYTTGQRSGTFGWPMA